MLTPFRHSRHCEHSEAIHLAARIEPALNMDRFVASLLAMTANGLKAVKAFGVAAENQRLLYRGEMRRERGRGVEPALVARCQRRDRPVGAEDQAFRPEDREEMRDIRREVGLAPIGRRFGDKAGELAANGAVA